MHSCLYEGFVQHRRLTPALHVFRYRLYMAYLDLDELPALLAGGIGLSRSWFSPASFLRTDHLGDARLPIAAAVRDAVESQTGWRPSGPIRLLTLLRNWGYYFSPLNIYYCFNPAGSAVESVVAEVTNTPWLERHCYVLWQGIRNSDANDITYVQTKEFHVSPFMDMDMRYEWRVREPGVDLGVEIVNLRQGERFFDVRLELQRRQLTPGTMIKTLLRYPWMTGRITAAIYWQAFWLWWKKCPYYAHPRSGPASGKQAP